MKKNRDVFDVMKIVLSLFVVGIHTELFVEILNPIFRMAVPLYFITSSYFFFGKIHFIKSNEVKRLYLKEFVKRNLRLYAFWFILLFPVTVILRGWQNQKLVFVCIDIIKRFLFNSTFRASWYIMALIIGVSVVYFLSKIIPDKIIFWGSFSIYVIACLVSNYYGLFSHDFIIIRLYEWYMRHFVSLLNSWPISLIWICIGKMIAEKDKENYMNLEFYVIVGVLSFVCLYFEQLYILNKDISKVNDCYFSLIPLCWMIFLIIKNMNFTCKKAFALRKLSTILYVTHASTIDILNAMLKVFNIRNSLLTFILVIVIGIVIYHMISILEKNKYFKWLKYSY